MIPVINSINCNNHMEVIQITQATWGRSDCLPYAANSMSATQAKWVLRSCTTFVVKLVFVPFSCDGKSSCTLTDYNNVYGDPCSGWSKTMEVKYVCVPGDDLFTPWYQTKPKIKLLARYDWFHSSPIWCPPHIFLFRLHHGNRYHLHVERHDKRWIHTEF